MPAHRLQVYHAAQFKPVLEMQEPIAAVRRCDPRALVGAVDGAGPLVHDDFFLIRAVHIAGAQHGLPAVFHTACRDKDVIPAVALVHFGAFGGGLAQGAIKHDGAVLHHFQCFGIQAGKLDLVLNAAAAFGKGVGHIHAAVIVPQGAGIDPPAGGFYAVQRTPGAGGVGGFGVKNALVRQGNECIEPARMVAQRRGPGAAAMGGLGIAVKRQTLHAVANALPVDKILAVQHRHARQVGKAGRDQVIVLPHADGVGVAEIHGQHRVLVAAIFDIGHITVHCFYPFLCSISSSSSHAASSTQAEAHRLWLNQLQNGLPSLKRSTSSPSLGHQRSDKMP